MVSKLSEMKSKFKYTFNSFKYMGEFDIEELQEAENKPFRILNFVMTMVMGALNSDPKHFVSEEEVQTLVEEYIEADESLSDLIELLMALLQESSFFKALQKK